MSLLMYSPWVTFPQTLRVLTSDLLPLESAFHPTYSTAMNLWLRPEDEERLANLYARSLRRFQHDRTLKELTERKQALDDAFAAERAADGAKSRARSPQARSSPSTSAELSRVDYELRRSARAPPPSRRGAPSKVWRAYSSATTISGMLGRRSRRPICEASSIRTRSP